MSIRSTIGLATVAAAVLFAQQPADDTRAKESALKQDLLILRQAIDKYTADQHKAPATLQDLVVKGYVGVVPVDPMTRKSTWRVIMEEPGRSANRKQPGIYDVRSNSDGVSSDGTRYADW